MKTTITTTGGKGREVNPHPYNYDHSQYPSQDYFVFEASVEWHDCYLPNGEPYLETGQIEAVEVWQLYDHDLKRWEDYESMGKSGVTFKKFQSFFRTTRCIWRIITPEPKEDTNLLEAVYGPGNDNYGRDKGIEPKEDKQGEKTFKGTPGPWMWKPDMNLTGYYIETVDRSHDKTFIGEVGGGRQTMFEIQANANLIAAAPELLEALIELANLFPSLTFEHQNARAKAQQAINQALK